MYRFVTDLTEEQKHRRRELLDFYGYLAQISVIAPLVAIVTYAWTVRLLAKYAKREDIRAPSSPRVKASRLNHNLSATGLRIKWQRLCWWCGDSLDAAGIHYGTKGTILGAGLWSAWLLVLCFSQTGDDYLHLTKRFGIVAASQLPFHYLLSLKSPYSPLQLVTGVSHESLNSIHQLLGRIITLFLYAHGALYLNFYILNGLVTSKLKEFYVLCGIFGIVSFTVIGTTALKPLRDRSYRVFYITHVSLATILLPALYFHVDHIRPYLYETFFVYALSAALRLVATKTYTGTVRQVSNSLVEVTIPVSRSEAKWQPGQHAYVSLKGHPLLRTFKSNPFTVASIPPIDGHLRFMARILDGNTAKLAQYAARSCKFAVEGPYGLATHSETLLRYDRILLVAGGVGATFIVPLYRQILSDLSPSKGSFRRQRVNFIWAARSLADVTWALPEDDKERDGFVERSTVYLTQDAEGVATTSKEEITTDGNDEEEEMPGEAGVELEERKTLLEDRSDERSVGNGSFGGGLAVRAGRPDLAQLVEKTFAHNESERVAIVVCGPRSLSHKLRREIVIWVKRGRRDVWIWDEVFGL